MIADDPGDAVGLVLALRDRGVARPLGAADVDRGTLHLQAIRRIGLAFLDLAMGQLARMDRIAPGVLRAGEVVRHCLDLEDVQAAEIGDLLEAERGIVDQPGSGRMRHQGSGLGHGFSPVKIEGPPLSGRP